MQNTSPFTIRIFVPDGNPEGVRVIDRMNWTGRGVVFPRDEWQTTCRRPEFEFIGVYILIGYKDQDDLPTIYIGQTDNLRDRFKSHAEQKDFWSWACCFISSNNGLNRGHVTWLEWALIRQARNAARCLLDNTTFPKEPALSESEKADTEFFLNEILQILPLVGLRAFEMPKIVSANPINKQLSTAGLKTQNDTIIVPAQKEGFEEVFLGEDSWYAVRIAGGMLEKIKWIAAYQTQPISAITHIAEVDYIQPYGESGKYKIFFKGKAKKIVHPIPFGNAPSGSMQGSRYTTHQKLLKAEKITDLF